MENIKAKSIIGPQNSLIEGVWPPATGLSKSLIEKVNGNSVLLGDLTKKIFTGLQTSADKVYVLEKRSDNENGVTRVYSKELNKDFKLETELLKPLLSGKHVDKFYALSTNQLLLFPYEVANEKAELIEEGKFKKAFPKAWNYLLDNKHVLENREKGKMQHERWYAFGRTQSLALHEKTKKLAIPRLVHSLQVFYDIEGEFYLDNVDVGGIILKENKDDAYFYLLGLLNSKLIDWYFRQISAPFRGGFRSANRQFLELLPIHMIDYKDKSLKDDLVVSVKHMVTLKQHLAKSTPGSTEHDNLVHQNDQLEAEIEDFVYKLYGVSTQERAIIEEQV